MLENTDENLPRQASIPLRRILLTVGAIAIAGMFQSAAAATRCVNSSGTRGCYSSIQSAVDAAAPGDSIHVAPGTYREQVTIVIPLSLIGDNVHSTIIDAKGLPNGINVDGMDNPGLAGVVIAGFTVENAQYEGIVVTNASDVTVRDNVVVHNDLNFDPSGPSCPGIASWETAENFDCGEGIHISGVDHSVVARNLVTQNAGGILVTDDTGATHDNLITGNIARNNPYDCGITLASHPSATGSAPFGVYHNTISENESSSNGLAIEGAGAGVGIFDSIPGTQNYGNVVIHNRLIGNGLPGVAMHSHAPGQNLTDNAIIGNYIAGNGADTEDAATPGPTGINVYGVSAAAGTVISQNVIKNEAIAVAVKTPAMLQVHLNDLTVKGTGVDNLGSDPVDATQNWWGCRGGPPAPGCSTTEGPSVTRYPALMQPFHRGK